MSTRTRLAALLLILAAAVAPAAAKEKPDARALRKTVQRLERKLAALEAEVAQLRSQRGTDKSDLDGVGSSPGPIDSTGKAARAAQLKVGQVLQAESEKSWWAAKVIGRLADGRVCVHFLGWEPSWDEIVTVDRLQRDDNAVSKARSAPRLASPVQETTNQVGTSRTGSEPLTNPGPIEPSSILVEASTPLFAGDPVHVKWNTTWWRGEVLELMPDGKVKIRYTGWGSNYDESVPRSSLRRLTQNATVNPPQ